MQVFIAETDDRLGTGLTVWDGAVTMAKYLEAVVGPAGLAGKCVLELGAGTGLVSGTVSGEVTWAIGILAQRRAAPAGPGASREVGNVITTAP